MREVVRGAPAAREGAVALGSGRLAQYRSDDAGSRAHRSCERASQSAPWLVLGSPVIEEGRAGTATSRYKATPASRSRSRSFAASRYVLYFYPADDTPGCTAQACGIRDDWEAYQERGAVDPRRQPRRRRLARPLQGQVRAAVHAARRPGSQDRGAVRRLGREEPLRQHRDRHHPLDVRDRRERRRREGDAQRAREGPLREGARRAPLARRHECG